MTDPAAAVPATPQFQMRYREPQTFTCRRHGDYQGREFTVTGKSWIPPTCPSCGQEKKERELAEKRETTRSRQESKRDRILARSGIPPRYWNKTLDSYSSNVPGQARVFEVCKRYIEAFPNRLRAGGGLVFAGAPGTGKTHLACAIVQDVLAAGNTALYVDAWSFISEVKSTFRKGASVTEEQVIDAHVTPDLLVIDDVGVQYGSDAERVILHRVIDMRYQRVRPTILIGNIDLDGMTEYIGARAMSRLREGGGVTLRLDWDDYRN